MLWAGAVTLFCCLSPGEPGCRLTETSWEVFLRSFLASRGTEEKGDSTCNTQLRHKHGFWFLGGCFLNGTEGTAAGGVLACLLIPLVLGCCLLFWGE